MRIHLPLPLRRVAALFRWNRRDHDMEHEMTYHLDALTRDLMRSGMSEDAATAAARRRFGPMLRLKEEGHDARTARLLEDTWRDLRHVLRGLRRTPGFAAAVIVTLAVGIGGNAAIFSIVDQVLLRPLPYPNPDRLVAVYEAMPRTRRNVVSPANWLDWQRENRSFDSLAAWMPLPVTLTGVGEPLRLQQQIVSAEFFPLLGVAPLLGRTIADTDDRPNAPRVSVLAYRLWQSRFQSDPSVIGRVVTLDGSPATIVGVMPERFAFLYPNNDLWSAAQFPRQLNWRDSAGRFLNVVGRLRPEASLAAAGRDMEQIAARLATEYEFNRNTSVTLVPLREQLTGDVRQSLLVLYAAVGVLLLIACVNVANLLLARAAARDRELAVRTSLGAGRGAIVRQVALESVLLAMIGGAVGAALARTGVRALVALAPPDLLRVQDLHVDGRVLLYALLLAVAVGVVVGIVPGAVTSRLSIVSALRSGGAQTTRTPRLRQVLVVTQVALTVILLCGATLLVRTMISLGRVQSGIQPAHLLTLDASVTEARYPADRTADFFQRVVDALAALPGVSSAGAGNSLAVIGTPRGGTRFHRLGTPAVSRSNMPSTTVRVVTPGYFRTLGIPVLRGREFGAQDAGSPRQGFVVNEAFVRAFLADVEPLSVSLSVRMQRPENPYLPVIGVVGDVSEGSVRAGAQPTVFYSQWQLPETAMTVFIRTEHPDAIAGAAIAAIHRLDASVPVTRVQTMEHALAESLARERLNAVVSSAFATAGLLLASVGVYGLLAYLVTERTKELGIRIALGARIPRLVAAVVADGVWLAGVGAVIGLAAALVLLRPTAALLAGVTPQDPSTYLLVLAVMTSVSALAAYMPARRAARIQPLVALRQE